MLGWMLKRGENASNAVQDDDDTTQIDQPDTPAPVFAARAFRTALFGSPSRRHQATHSRLQRRPTMADRESGTPTKPPGILLTPGTGTSRRKRVSFGNEIAPRAGAAVAPTTSTITEEAGSEDDWEEADDSDNFTNDVTLDLNDPHSNSGKYWKEEFQKYHEDAKAEMERLLKYKQLAKSYAQDKNEEAIRLAERLKEEQQKVAKMEQMMAENARYIQEAAQSPTADSTAASTELQNKLSQQTTLVAEYRERAQQLEEELEAVLRDKEDLELREHRGWQASASPSPSPGSQKALLETQRELRKARKEVKEMNSLRDQLTTLKGQLQQAKSDKLHREDHTDAPRARELRDQLRASQRESKKKDEELYNMALEFEAFRQETEAHNEDTRAVLERAQSKIAELKKEVKSLKAAASHEKLRPKSWHAHESELSVQERRISSELQDANIGAISQQRGLDLDMNRRINKPSRSRSLREKFQDDGLSRRNSGNIPVMDEAAIARPGRKSSEKSTWQPFVPKSPRNRDSLRDEIANRLKNVGATPAAANTSKSFQLLGLPGAFPSKAKEIETNELGAYEDGVDLLQHRFAKLGGPDMASLGGHNNHRTATSRGTTIPPERRAAALARIEKRMAEKKKTRSRSFPDKENVRPRQAYNL